jgi:putative addiction module killer protein
MSTIIKVIIYTANNGKQPFIEWQQELDAKAKVVILSRLARIRGGNLGDCKQIKGGEGIWEFRIDYGSGYRIYFGKKGTTIIVLLTGGDKGSQNRDIAKAKRYWLAYKESINE